MALSSFITDKVNKPKPKLWRRISLTWLHCRPPHSQTIYVLSRTSRTFLTPDSSTLECSAIQGFWETDELVKAKGHLPRRHGNFPILLVSRGHDQISCRAIHLKYYFISHSRCFFPQSLQRFEIFRPELRNIPYAGRNVTCQEAKKRFFRLTKGKRPHYFSKGIGHEWPEIRFREKGILWNRIRVSLL